MRPKRLHDRAGKWPHRDHSAMVMGEWERSGCLEMWGLFREFMEFSWSQKKFWMIPIILALMLVGTLAVISESSMLSAFIYPFF